MIYGKGSIHLDTDSGDILYRNKKGRLSQVETEIMEMFMVDPGRVYSRSELAGYGSGNANFLISNAVDVHIKNIRRKLGDKKRQVIETIRGKGYRLVI